MDPTKPTRTSDASFNLATTKTKEGTWRLAGGSRVFVCSWSDFFDEAAPDSWRYEYFEQVKARPDVDFIFLTKSAENMTRFMSTVWAPNVWLGVTVEGQSDADHRLPYLERVPWPKVRFVCAEPLRGPLDLTAWASMLSWVIVGGQSGRGAPPVTPAWIHSLQGQCLENNSSFWFAQWGEWRPVGSSMCPGKAPAELHGAKAQEYPIPRPVVAEGS